VDEPIWISEALALAIHDRQIAEHGGESGIRDRTGLAAALGRLRNLFAYEREASDLARLAAAYLFGFVQNHPFVDGNKRVGLVVCGTFLRLNGTRLAAPLSEFYAAVLAVAKGELREDELAEWVRSHAGN
jgi:death-on-curing protein